MRTIYAYAMSYIVVLVLIAFIGMIAELSASRHTLLQKQIYYLTFAAVAIWCTIKYAIGPDIRFYIPFYNGLQSPQYTVTHLSDLSFEPGFTFFCSILHTCGISFWGMTAIISIFYFAVIFQLFKKIQGYQTLALLMLVCLDYNLILMEFRQCLAVSFFYLFILLSEKKKYGWAMVMAILSTTMHKSAIIVLALFGLLYLAGKVRVSKQEYILLAVLIIGLLFIPLQPLLLKVVEMLPLSSTQLISAKHHLTVGTPFQKILFVYLASILCLAYYSIPKEGNIRRHWIVWCSVALLVCLYPYWFLLNRLRSFFLPFLIIYIANTIQSSEKKDTLMKQIYAMILVVYSVVLMLDIPQKNKQLRSPTDSISLVVERFEHSEEELQKRQMAQAILYWDYDYKEMIKRGQQ